MNSCSAYTHRRVMKMRAATTALYGPPTLSERTVEATKTMYASKRMRPRAQQARRWATAMERSARRASAASLARPEEVEEEEEERMRQLLPWYTPYEKASFLCV